MTAVAELPPAAPTPPSQEKLALIHRAARVELARRAAKRGDVLTWGKMLFPDKFPLPFCQELHQYFVDVRGEAMTNTEAPRNHSKTTIKCFLIPLFQALEEPATFHHYLNVQATNAKALSINVAIRAEIETNEDLRYLYGDQMGHDRWSDQQFVLSNGTIFTAISAGQSIRGLNYRSIRPDYIIIDDLYDEEDINNPESTGKKNAWFWGSLYPCRARSRRNAIHVQGTAINHEDLLEELKTKERWKSRTFAAVKDWDKGIVLWPELNTLASLQADLKDMPSVIFFRELQNERRDEASSIVKASWLKNADYDWEFDPATLKFDLHHFVTDVLLGVDPSIGEKLQSDSTGIALVIKAGYDDGKGAMYYVMDLWEEQITMDARVRLLQKIKDEQPRERQLTSCLIESIAGFKDFTAEVIRRNTLPVKEIVHVKDKISTLINKSHFFENRRVRVSKNIDKRLRDTLAHQLTTNYPKHDDVKDAVLLCLDDQSGAWSWV